MLRPLIILCTVVLGSLTSPGQDPSEEIFRLELLVDEKAIPAEVEIQRVEIDHQINAIATARLWFKENDPAQDDELWSESDWFVPGKPLEVRASWGSSGGGRVFRGVIVEQRLKLGARGQNLQITCQDQAHRMASVRPRPGLAPATAKELAEKLAARNQMNIAAPLDTKGLFSGARPEAMSDWDHLLLLARHAGRVIVTDDGTVRFSEPMITGMRPRDIDIESMVFAQDLRLDPTHQVPTVMIPARLLEQSAQNPDQKAWIVAVQPKLNRHGNLSAQALAQAIGASPLLLRQESIHAAAPLSNEALQALVDAEFLFRGLSRIRGTVTILGDNKVTPNSLVKMDGVGDRLSGDAYVSGVRHLFVAGQWTTDLLIGYPFGP